MVLVVGVDGDIVEVGGGKEGAEFVGGVSVHAVDYLLPLLVFACQTVVLVDDEKVAAIFQHAVHPSEAVLYIGPEIYCLKCGDEVKFAVLIG